MSSPAILANDAALQGTIRFGIIGCGALGLVHALRLTDLPDVRVTAVSDPDTAAMQRIIDALRDKGIDYPIAAYADYREMLASESLEASCINSPNRWHVEQLLASLKAGLHTLCEKPLSMIPDEVDTVIQATQASGKLVAIAYQTRYRHDTRVLRRALLSGKWGKITSVSLFACENWVTPNRNTWRHDPARCPGGYFADANGHQLDALFWMTGLEAATVRATTEQRGTPVPIVTWGEARLRPQGAANPEGEEPPLLTFSFIGDAKLWREQISIQTEGADFVMRDTKLLWSEGEAPLSEFPESLLGEPEDDDTPDTAFVKALRGKAPLLSPPESVFPVLNFTLAALASASAQSVTQSIAPR